MMQVFIFSIVALNEGGSNGSDTHKARKKKKKKNPGKLQEKTYPQMGGQRDKDIKGKNVISS